MRTTFFRNKIFRRSRVRCCNAVCCERAGFTLTRDSWARECGTDTEGTQSARLPFSLRASALNSRAAGTRTGIVANRRSTDDPVGRPATGEESGSSLLQSRMCEHYRIARIGNGSITDFPDVFRTKFLSSVPIREIRGLFSDSSARIRRGFDSLKARPHLGGVFHRSYFVGSVPRCLVARSPRFRIRINKT